MYLPLWILVGAALLFVPSRAYLWVGEWLMAAAIGALWLIVSLPFLLVRLWALIGMYAGPILLVFSIGWMGTVYFVASGLKAQDVANWAFVASACSAWWAIGFQLTGWFRKQESATRRHPTAH